LWDAASGAALATFDGHTSEVDSAAFSPDGMWVVTASSDGTARLWDAASGAALATFEGHTDDVRSAAFSPDGKWVVTASRDGTARLWDAASGAALATFWGHTGRVFNAAFSPDGKRVVTASHDGTARLWDASNGTALATLEGHASWVWTAAFSRDGKRVVTAGDQTARLWDASNGAALATFEGHKSSVWRAAFSPGGERVVTASRDGTARLWWVWPLLRDDTAAYTRIAAMRVLTPEERSRLFLPVAIVGASEIIPEPDRHRELAERFEQAEGTRRDLERALFHYAIATRLYEEQGDEEEAAPCRMRRGSLAHVLPPETAVRIAYEAADWQPLPR
jgi:Tol biopolymer transport system component